MNPIRKFFLTFGLVVPMLCIPAPRVEATAAGDALLLIQQVLQYVQDFTTWKRNIDDKKAELKELFELGKKLTQGAQQGIQSITNISNCLKTIDSTFDEMQVIFRFVSNNTDREDLLQNSEEIAKYFKKVGKQYVEQAKVVITHLNGLSLNPQELLNMLDEVTMSLVDNVTLQRQEAMSMIMLVCDDVVIDQCVQANQSFVEKTII